MYFEMRKQRPGGNAYTYKKDGMRLRNPTLKFCIG